MHNIISISVSFINSALNTSTFLGVSYVTTGDDIFSQEPSSGHPAISLFRVDPEDDRLEPDGSQTQLHARRVRPVFSYKLRYIVGFGFVEMAISTNPKPTIYPNLYENTGWGQRFLLRAIMCHATLLSSVSLDSGIKLWMNELDFRPP